MLTDALFLEKPFGKFTSAFPDSSVSKLTRTRLPFSEVTRQKKMQQNTIQQKIDML